MDVIKELKKIQKNLIKETFGFPKNKCSLASKVVFEKLGFLPVAGSVLTSKGLKEHSWNIDDEGRVVDLTFYQFDTSAPKIIYSSPEDVCQDKGYFINNKITSYLREFISLENSRGFFHA